LKKITFFADKINVYFLNLFLNNYLVYCRILFTFFGVVISWLKKTILKTYPPKVRFWTSPLRSDSGFTDLLKIVSQMNPKEFLHNTANSPYIAGLSLQKCKIKIKNYNRSKPRISGYCGVSSFSDWLRICWIWSV